MEQISLKHGEVLWSAEARGACIKILEKGISRSDSYTKT